MCIVCIYDNSDITTTTPSNYSYDIVIIMYQEGDQLIAVDHFNTTDASAKGTQRLMGALSWPRVLVFETK